MANAQEVAHGSKRLCTAEHELDDDDESIWICSAEGQNIRWPRAAAECADAILLAFDLSRNAGLVKLECARL